MVYLVHFETLGVMKIGITNMEERRYDRIGCHLAHGAVLVDSNVVPNREAALVVEAEILNMMADYRIPGMRRHFPQGGWTETWSDSAPTFELAAAVSELSSKLAPGFDRASRLEKYFQEHPITIEELKEFVALNEVSVGECTVHAIGLACLHENMLRKIRCKRDAAITATVRNLP